MLKSNRAPDSLAGSRRWRKVACLDENQREAIGLRARHKQSGRLRTPPLQLPISAAIVVSPEKPIDENDAWARSQLKLQGWAAPREFFTIRDWVKEPQSAVGGRLIEVEGDTFRVFVSHRQGDGAKLLRDCNRRACIEPHIDELKNDLQVEAGSFESANLVAACLVAAGEG